jgi:hypothetical protein
VNRESAPAGRFGWRAINWDMRLYSAIHPPEVGKVRSARDKFRDQGFFISTGCNPLKRLDSKNKREQMKANLLTVTPIY